MICILQAYPWMEHSPTAPRWIDQTASAQKQLDAAQLIAVQSLDQDSNLYTKVPVVWEGHAPWYSASTVNTDNQSEQSVAMTKRNGESPPTDGSVPSLSSSNDKWNETIKGFVQAVNRGATCDIQGIDGAQPSSANDDEAASTHGVTHDGVTHAFTHGQLPLYSAQHSMHSYPHPHPHPHPALEMPESPASHDSWHSTCWWHEPVASRHSLFRNDSLLAGSPHPTPPLSNSSISRLSENLSSPRSARVFDYRAGHFLSSSHRQVQIVSKKYCVTQIKKRRMTCV